MPIKNMRKIGSKLKKFVYALPIMLGLAGGLKEGYGQYNSPINLFVHPVESQYDNLETKEERDNHLQNFLNENPHDAMHIPSIRDVFDCTEYSNLIAVDGYGTYTNDFNGYSGEDIDSIHFNKGTLSRKATGKAPVLCSSIEYLSGPVNGYWSHEFNVVYTGDNFNWESATPIEPQGDDINFQPGSWQMPMNCDIYVKGPPTENWSPIKSPILMKYEVREGIVSEPIFEDALINPANAQLLIRERDKDAPQNNFNFRNDTLEYEVLDENLDSIKFSYDEGQTWQHFSNATGTKKLNLENGLYHGIFESKDKFRNKTRTEQDFYVDNRPNELEKQVLNSDIKVYPNPASDYLNFSAESNKEANVTMYSVDGKEVGKEYSVGGKINMDVSNYAPGVYLYQFKENDENSNIIKTGKVVVK
jgi:hypothetical protein